MCVFNLYKDMKSSAKVFKNNLNARVYGMQQSARKSQDSWPIKLVKSRLRIPVGRYLGIRQDS